VADDGARVAGLNRDAIHVIPNPVITPELTTRAAEPVDHPWLNDPEGPPVVMGVGRLTDAKDFPTLLRAFARLREKRPARLILLGEGKQEEPLRELATELGIGEDVDLPGFAANPYAWMARADAFALSSKVEGSPIVLTEALALGVPAVATDCRSGPREVLAERWLAPVGDDAALAERLAAVLDAPPDPGTLKASVAAYNADASARRHLEVMGLE
jgi:glycosyltransferase involved in cell wall biosynthesis